MTSKNCDFPAFRMSKMQKFPGVSPRNPQKRYKMGGDKNFDGGGLDNFSTDGGGVAPPPPPRPPHGTSPACYLPSRKTYDNSPMRQARRSRVLKLQASSLTTGPGSCRINLERINYEKTKTRISNRWQQAPRNFRQSSRVPEGSKVRAPGR